jgi:hypothetical protein
MGQEINFFANKSLKIGRFGDLKKLIVATEIKEFKKKHTCRLPNYF